MREVEQRVQQRLTLAARKLVEIVEHKDDANLGALAHAQLVGHELQLPTDVARRQPLVDRDAQLLHDALDTLVVTHAVSKTAE